MRPHRCGLRPFHRLWSRSCRPVLLRSLNTNKYYGVLNTVGDGVNNAGYVFSAPAPKTLNTSIVKIDYILSAKQHLFFRGNLQKDTGNLESSFTSGRLPGLVNTDTCGVENLPGQPSNTWSEDNTKGFP